MQQKVVANISCALHLLCHVQVNWTLNCAQLSQEPESYAHKFVYRNGGALWKRIRWWDGCNGGVQQQHEGRIEHFIASFKIMQLRYSWILSDGRYHANKLRWEVNPLEDDSLCWWLRIETSCWSTMDFPFWFIWWDLHTKECSSGWNNNTWGSEWPVGKLSNEYKFP